MDARIKQLIEDGLWYVWPIYYTITHGFMRLALHRGDFVDRIELGCRDVVYFKGWTQGGPLRLAVKEIPAQDGPLLLITDDKDELRIECSDVRTLKPQEPLSITD
jgi:hypothetical protein